jgi:hypothetical protein
MIDLRLVSSKVLCASGIKLGSAKARDCVNKRIIQWAIKSSLASGLAAFATKARHSSQRIVVGRLRGLVTEEVVTREGRELASEKRREPWPPVQHTVQDTRGSHAIIRRYERRRIKEDGFMTCEGRTRQEGAADGLFPRKLGRSLLDWMTKLVLNFPSTSTANPLNIPSLPHLAVKNCQTG